MNVAFEKHRDKRTSKVHERRRNNRLNKKIESETFGQRVKKGVEKYQ